MNKISPKELIKIDPKLIHNKMLIKHKTKEQEKQKKNEEI